MAVSLVSVKETWPEGAGGSWDADISSDGSLTVTRTFVVIYTPLLGDNADSANERKYHAYSADATALIPPSQKIPALGSRLTSDPLQGVFYKAFLDSINVDPLDQYVFLVKCTYGNNANSWSSSGGDPWDEPWEISFPTKSEKEIIPQSVLTPTEGVDPAVKVAVPSGSDFATVPGEFYDPVPQENFYPIEIALKKNYQNLPAFRAAVQSYLALRGRINDAAITIADVAIAKHYGRITSLSIDPAYFKGEVYWVLTATVQVNDKPWYRIYNHKGTYYLDATTKKKVYNVDKAQRKDATKAWIKVDGTGFADPATEKNYRVFGAIRQADWTILAWPAGLPLT